MSENPYQSAETEAPPVAQPTSRVGLVILGLVAVVLIVLFGSPLIRTARPAADRNHCQNNTKQILLGLINYHDEHGTLPPVYTVDAQGNRLHSWRALILPYIEGNRAHELIDFTKPWDDPANARAREVVMEAYRCPSTSLDDEHLTTYLAVVGPACVFTGPEGRSFDDIPGALSNTIAIVDAPADKAIHWMSPDDITIDEVLRINEETDAQHPEGIVAGFPDGSVSFIYLEIEREKLRAMLTVADDAPITE